MKKQYYLTSSHTGSKDVSNLGDTKEKAVESLKFKAMLRSAPFLGNYIIKSKYVLKCLDTQETYNLRRFELPDGYRVDHKY